MAMKQFFLLLQRTEKQRSLAIRVPLQQGLVAEYFMIAYKAAVEKYFSISFQQNNWKFWLLHVLYITKMQLKKVKSSTESIIF